MRLHSLKPVSRRLHSRLSLRPAKGQAMIEFAMTLALMLLLVITTINMLPAISARGTVMNAAAAATDGTARFLAPASGSTAGDRQLACQLAYRTARSVLTRVVTGGGQGDTLPVSGSNITACNTDPAIANPAINITTSGRLMPGQTFTLCLTYTWRPTGGLFWLTFNGPFALSDWTQTLFTYRYCGNDTVHENRTR